MKILEISKELGVTNKEMITYLREQGFEAKSHMQAASEDMIKAAREHFKVEKKPVEKTEKVKSPKRVITTDVEKSMNRRFDPDEMIPVKSITPWKVVETSADRNIVYRWGGFGDVEYVPYKDLSSWRRKPIIKDGLVMIEDADICMQWEKEIGEIYKYFLKVEYPEEFFDRSDDDFRKLLTDAPDAIKEVVKYTAINMIHNTNYPSVQKVAIIDELLNTCIKDFL